MTAALLLASLVGIPMKAKATTSAMPARASTSAMSVSSSVTSRLSGPVASEPEAGGTHTRLETRHGPVHLFRPAGFD